MYLVKVGQPQRVVINAWRGPQTRGGGVLVVVVVVGFILAVLYLPKPSLATAMPVNG